MLLGVLAIALGLRLWGIGFGLPYEYHVDEVQYVRQAASMGAEGLEPVWWNNPPAYKYLLLAEYAGLYATGRLLGWYASVAEFGSRLSGDPTLLYLLARGTTALLGALTVWMVYRLGRVMHNRRTGLVAAWFLAVCFLHVRDSHYAVNDVPATLLVTVAVLAAVMVARSGERRWYLLGGLALGLGFATKYSAAIAAVPLVLAHLMSPSVELRNPARLHLSRLALALAAAVVAAVVASPYFILTPGRVVRDAYQALVLAGRYGFQGWEIDPAGGYVFYLKTLIWGAGWGLLVLTAGGVAWGALRHRREDVVVLSLPVVMYVLIGSQKMYFARFMLPMVPALVTLAAAFLDGLLGRWPGDGRAAAAVAGAAVLAFSAQPLACSLRSDYLLTRTDTRTLAKEWIEHNLPEGARIAVDWRTHGPPLSTPEMVVPGSSRRYDVLTVGGSGLPEHPLAWYREQDFDYLVATGHISRISLVDSERDAARRAFYASLDQEQRLAWKVQPAAQELPFTFEEIYGPTLGLWQRERPGPIVEIYQIGD